MKSPKNDLPLKAETPCADREMSRSLCIVLLLLTCDSLSASRRRYHSPNPSVPIAPLGVNYSTAEPLRRFEQDLWSLPPPLNAVMGVVPHLHEGELYPSRMAVQVKSVTPGRVASQHVWVMMMAIRG